MGGFLANLKTEIEEHRSFWLSAILHLVLILIVMLWASDMIEPIALSSSSSAMPTLEAQVLEESPMMTHEVSKPVIQPVIQPKPIIEEQPKVEPVKDTVPIIHEKPKAKRVHKPISKPVSKPVSKTKTEAHPVTHPPKTKTQPIKKNMMTAQEVKNLQNEALASLKQSQLQSQIAAQNQARYLTERDQYMALLSQVIRSHWINQFQDPSLQVNLKIQQDAQGNILNVSVAQSSGNSVFDRSAVIAVQKSSPLPLPQDVQLVGDTREMTLAFSE